MSESVPLKRCSRKEKCVNPLGAWLPATDEYFRPSRSVKSSKSGLRGSCRVCDLNDKRNYRQSHHEEHLNSTRLWRESNPDKVKSYSRAYYDSHADERRTYSLEWFRRDPERARSLKRSRYANNAEREREKAKEKRRVNPERFREAVRKYDKSHRDKRRANANKRRFAKKTRGSFTAADIQLQLRSQLNKCWHCGAEIVGNKYHADHLIPLARGGSNAPENIVISCPTCNLSKGAKLPQEWNGRLF